MAKRRKKSATRRRSRRMGAAAGNMLTNIGGLAVGAILAKQLNKVLKFDARIVAAGKVVLGAYLPKLVKTPIVNSVGQGMIAVGATELIGSFVPALGAADDVVLLSGLDEIGEVDMIGAGDIAEVNGLDEIGAMDIAEVNGMEESF